jgi:hypothetical protein
MKSHRLDIDWTKYVVNSEIDIVSHHFIIAIFIKFKVDLPSKYDIID